MRAAIKNGSEYCGCNPIPRVKKHDLYDVYANNQTISNFEQFEVARIKSNDLSRKTNKN